MDSLYAQKEGFDAVRDASPAEQELWFYGGEDGYENEVRRMRNELKAKKSQETNEKKKMDYVKQSCPKCKSKTVTSKQYQLRAADEGMDTILECHSCGWLKKIAN